jgi:hypothetical protein
MLIKGSVFKLILGGLFTLGLSAAAAGVIYLAFLKPYVPTNLNVTIDTTAGSCEPVITFRDNSQNEDDFRLYRWNPPNTLMTLIQIFPASQGKGTQLSYTDSALPTGTYFYKVSAYNKFGESESDMKSVPVMDPCALVPPVDPSKLPMNPIIVSLSIINDCSVRISYRDNSTNEQGLKIYRRDSSFSLIKTLGPHAGIPGTYDDNTRLPVGTYGYRIAAFNQNGESDSNYSTIDVTSVCNPGVKFAPTVDALLVPTAQKLSVNTCNWEAATNVYLRKGPNVAVFDRLVYEVAGQSFPIVGQSENGRFWAVQVGPGVVGYITKSTEYSLTHGDCSSVPPLKDPAPPEVAPTPTINSGGNNNGAATPCPVGAVCP